jgi:hypothetical protein
MQTTPLLLFLIATAAGLAWLYRRGRSATRRTRREMFAACADLLAEPSLSQDGVGYPALAGKFRDRDVKIAVLPDSVGYRKVPSLWLEVTLKTPIAMDCSIDLLVRPQSIEFYSPWMQLPHSPTLPYGWPEHAVLRSDHAHPAGALAALSPHVAALFAAPRAKEMLVTPRGVKLVYQLCQAERADYLVFRSAQFENMRVEPELLSMLLDCATNVAADLNATQRIVANATRTDRAAQFIATPGKPQAAA